MKNIILFYQKLTFPFIFDAAEKEGVCIHIVTHPQDVLSPLEFIQAQYPCVVNVHPIDIFEDETAALTQLKDYVESQSINYMLCFRDEAIPFVSKASALLGLPHFNTEDVSFKARDKSIMRKAFRSAGCNVPSFLRINPRDFICADLGALHFPVVVKPVSGFGSMGVTCVNSETELLNAIVQVNELNEKRLSSLSCFDGNHYEGILIEEFINGPEFVAETFSQGGQHFILLIGEKGDPKGPYFEESIYLAPARISEQEQKAIEAEVCRALSAIGLQNGPAHVELRLSQIDGKPYVVEIGARIGGSGVSHFIVESVYGLSMFALCLKQLDGENVEELIKSALNKSDNKVAINYIIPVGKGGVIKEILGLDVMQRHRDTKKVIRFMKEGQQVNPYPDFIGYPGFILSTHGSYADAKNYLTLIEDNVKVVFDQ